MKDVLLTSSTKSGNLYGKTGTGAVNGREVNGWFVGFVETDENVYVFAVNIQNDSNATGLTAKDTALSILHDYHIFMADNE